jgi:hypothetical protein
MKCRKVLVFLEQNHQYYMKTTISTFTYIFFLLGIVNAQTISLKNSDQSSLSKFYANVNSNPLGESIVFERVFREQYIGNYNMERTFNKDISMLYNGGKFTLSFIKNNISIYKKENENKNLIEYKGELILNRINIETIIKVLKDYNNYSSWVYNCKRAEVQKKDDNCIYLYQISKATWPLKDRDYVLCLKPQSKINNKIIFPFSAVSSIIATNKKYVRIDAFNGKWIIEKLQGKIKVSMYGSFNPKMKLPNYLKKKYERNIPFNTLSKLKQIVQTMK